MPLNLQLRVRDSLISAHSTATLASELAKLMHLERLDLAFAC